MESISEFSDLTETDEELYKAILEIDEILFIIKNNAECISSRTIYVNLMGRFQKLKKLSKSLVDKKIIDIEEFEPFKILLENISKMSAIDYTIVILESYLINVEILEVKLPILLNILLRKIDIDLRPLIKLKSRI